MGRADFKWGGRRFEERANNNLMTGGREGGWDDIEEKGQTRMKFLPLSVHVIFVILFLSLTHTHKHTLSP